MIVYHLVSSLIIKRNEIYKINKLRKKKILKGNISITQQEKEICWIQGKEEVIQVTVVTVMCSKRS